MVNALHHWRFMVSRLHELESQKASWETERGALRESLMKKEEQAAETVSTLVVRRVTISDTISHLYVMRTYFGSTLLKYCSNLHRNAYCC